MERSTAFQRGETNMTSPINNHRESNQSYPREKQKLHFALIYSNPLIEIIEKGNNVKDKTRNVPAILNNDPVDFAKECDAIKDSINQSGKQIN